MDTRQPDYQRSLIDWRVDAALEAMDASGIAMAILSVSRPDVRWGPGGDPAQVRRLARTINEFCGDLVRDDPEHFAFFAALALPDTEASLDEAQYALEDLGAGDMVLFRNVDGTYVGSPRRDPFLNLLDERETVLFIHPTTLPEPLLEGVSPGAVDFVADSTRVAVNLVVHDSLFQYPRLRILLSHGGGYVPYTAARTASMLSRDADQADVLDQLRGFWFDTAVIGSRYALPSLLAVADPGHLRFGCGWPFESRRGGPLVHRAPQRLELPEAQRMPSSAGRRTAVSPGLGVRRADLQVW